MGKSVEETLKVLKGLQVESNERLLPEPDVLISRSKELNLSKDQLLTGLDIYWTKMHDSKRIMFRNYHYHFKDYIARNDNKDTKRFNMKTFSFKNSMSDVYSMDKKIGKCKNNINEESISMNAHDQLIDSHRIINDENIKKQDPNIPNKHGVTTEEMHQNKKSKNSKDEIRRLSKESERRMSKESERYNSKISERDMTMEKHKKGENS